MNKKRVFVLLIFLLLFVALIIVRQQKTRSMREKPIVSTFSQWQANGKPVFARKILLDDVNLFTKLTLSLMDKETFQGYVPKSIMEKLSPGQYIYIESDNKDVFGSISEISKDISLKTGMFRVQAVLTKPVNDNTRQIVYVNTATLHDVICVSDDIIDRKNKKTYLWKIDKGCAVRQEIEISQHNGYGAVVTKGLDVGDMVVYKGFTQLSENDPVNLIKETDDSGIKQ